jgi:hypothetical protein
VHLAKIVFWVAPALLVAVSIKLASGMSWWVAALIGIFALGVNVLVARIEEADSSGAAKMVPATKGRRLVRGTLRVAAVLIGVGALTVGVATFGDTWPSSSWWGMYVVPTAMALSGTYFLAYGIAGRDKPFSRRGL